MKSRKRIAAIVGIALLAGACTRPSASPNQEPLPIQVGAKAPPFTLRSAEGSTVSQSDYAGKPVLLYFSMGPG